jgi:hypothetical protein
MQIRDVEEEDWPSIAQLASNEVQEGDHSGGIDADWIARRRAPARDRIHAVLESGSTIVGYCAIERWDDEPSGLYRVFIVMDWESSDRDVPIRLFGQIEKMLIEAGADRAWMREVEDDRKLLRFVVDRGFVASTRYSIANKTVVNLSMAIGE